MAFAKKEEKPIVELGKTLSPAEYLKTLSKENQRSVVDLSKKRKYDFIRSGSWVIDALIGDGTLQNKSGGYPRGHVVEIFGDESSGKTTLGIMACKKVQEAGEIAFYLDYERTFHETYAKALGLNTTDKKTFILYTPDTFQQGTEFLAGSLQTKPALIVVDSVSAMTPSEFLTGDISDEQRIGRQAQLLSQFLGKITKYLSRTNTCLMFINQLRSVIKTNKYDKGPTEDTSGGRAMKFYTSVRLQLETGYVEQINVTSKITGKKDKEPVNIQVKVGVAKNKIDKPYKSAPIYIRFGQGFDNEMSLIDLAVNQNVIKKSGSYFTYLEDKKVIFNIQGKENLRDHLIEHVDVMKQIQDQAIPQVDAKIKEEFFKENEEEGFDAKLEALDAQLSAEDGVQIIEPKEEVKPEPKKAAKK